MEHRILQYSIDGTFIREWKNARKAAMEGHDSYGFIMKIMAGEKTKRKPNFIWRYYTPDYPKTIEPWNSSENGRNERTNDTIVELDWKGNPIASYNGTAEAARIVSSAPTGSTMPDRTPSAKAFPLLFPSAHSGMEIMAPSGKFWIAIPRARARAPPAVISVEPESRPA